MNILKEADEILNGDRMKAYGNPKESFERIAKFWSVVVGKELTAKDVGLMMVLFKVSREIHAHKPDNLRDIAGYAQTIQTIYDQDPIESFMDSEEVLKL